MKKLALIFSLIATLVAPANAVDVKLSQLPLGSAVSTGVNDSFPFVNYSGGVTERLKLSDIINLPSMNATYAPLANPRFTGNVGINASSATHALEVNSSADNYVAEFSNTNSTPGQNFGLEINAGTNGSDAAFTVNGFSTPSFFTVLGNGFIGAGTSSPGHVFDVTHSIANSYISQFTNTNTTAGTSFGLEINAGTNSSDSPFSILNAAQNTTLFSVLGNGVITSSALSVSLPVQTNASKQLISAAIDLSGSQATGTLAAGRMPALTGDVTSSAGSVSTTITNGVVTNAKLANMASTSSTSGTVKGNISGSTGAPGDLALTTSNAASSVPYRDSSGNFSAGTITASLTGTASGNLQATPNNHGVLVSGSGNTASVIPPDASSTKVLISNTTSGDPVWSLLTNSSLNGTAGITNANLASMSSSSSTVGTVKGNISGLSAVPSDLVLTSANTASSVPYRDSSGNFSAGTITATFSGNITGNVTGTASGNTTYTANNHGVVVSGSGNAMTVVPPDASSTKVLLSNTTSGDPVWSLLTNSSLNGTAGITNANLASMSSSSSTVGTVKGNISGSSAVPSDLVLTSANTASSVPYRDSSGNFSAGTITASLTGTASGNTTYTPNNHGVVVSGSGNTMTVVAPDASSTKVLLSNTASGDPVWSLLTNSSLNGTAGITNANLASMSSSSSTAGTVKGNISGSSAVPSDLVLASANTASSVPYRDSSGNFSAGTITASLTGTASGNLQATANNHGVLVSGSGNTASVIPPDASSTKVLISNTTSGDPVWSLLTNSSLNGTAGITNANLASMASSSSTVGTVKGNISGSSTTPSDITLTSAATASSAMYRDSNANSAVNAMVEGYTTQATVGASTTTLTVASTPYQNFTGSASQIVKLPVVSTLGVGQTFWISNESSGTLTVQTSDGSILALIYSGAASPSLGVFTVKVASGTGTSSWTSHLLPAFDNGDTGHALVFRDAAGDFSAGTITASFFNGSGANLTGTASSLTAGNVTTNANLTGDITSTGNATTAAATQANITSLSNSSGVSIHGTNTNTTRGAGIVGEYMEALQTTSTNVTTNNTYQDLGSLALTAGNWNLTGIVRFTLNGATSTYVEIFIGTVAGNDTTGRLLYSNYSNGAPPTSTNSTILTVPNFHVSLSGSQTYYLKVTSGFTAGNPQYMGRFSAIRTD